MKPHFKMVIKVDTLAHAKTIKDNIVAQLVGKDIFQEVKLDAYKEKDNSITGIAVFRFNNATDRNSIKDWAKDQIENHPVVKTWVTSARLSWHDCSHTDSQVTDCSTSNYAEWTK